MEWGWHARDGAGRAGRGLADLVSGCVTMVAMTWVWHTGKKLAACCWQRWTEIRSRDPTRDRLATRSGVMLLLRLFLYKRI